MKESKPELELLGVRKDQTVQTERMLFNFQTHKCSVSARININGGGVHQ